MNKQEISKLQIDLSKINAVGRKYFDLFDKHIPVGINGNILIYDISNADCIVNIIRKNPNAKYFIYGNSFVNEAIRCINEWDITFLDETFDLYNIDMKFDCIVMNPPYDGNKNLYGKLTLEAKMHAKEVVCLSPYLNYLSIAEKKDCKRISNILEQFLNFCQTIRNEFDASFDKKLAIFHFVDNPINKKYKFDDLYWSEFKNSVLAKNISIKFLNYCKNNKACLNNIVDEIEFNKYNFVCSFVNIRGNVNKQTGEKAWDWTTIFNKNQMENFNITAKAYAGFPFKTEQHCKNFITYSNSDITMFALFLVKKSFHNNKCNFKYIPYMPTYEKEWTDLEIANEIGLTNEELNYIYDEMKNYGWKTRK